MTGTTQRQHPGHPQPNRRTAGSVIQGLAALIALLALLAGAPLLLLAVAPNPLQILPTLDDLRAAVSQADPDGSVFIACLTWVGWLAWASLTVALILEVPAQLRGVRAPHLPGLGVQQQLVGGLVAAILALIVLPGGANAATPATTALSTPVAMTSTAATLDPGSPTDPARAGPTATARSSAHAGPIHIVQRQDTLWGIAEHHLGDGARWREIARANYGHEQADGHALAHDNVLQPGWHLQLPADAAARTAHTRANPATEHTVHKGDSLWGIAEQHFGDGDRWPEIARANYGVRQPDGHSLTRRHVLQPGWTLQLPSPAASAGADRPAAHAQPAPAARATPPATPSAAQPSTPPPTPSPAVTTPAASRTPVATVV
ncbi:MAG: hypothetical protein QOD63_1086, partial [Actinomycetota bacterium]|nr:hypothetical protein [Actinomycetota bacterium]